MDKASQAQRNNFAAWREASPKHNSLVDTILGANLHVIATMRSKTAWEVQKDEKTGKQKPVKVGLAPVQRDGLEYEFTSVLELSVDGHIATASKDRTRLFDGRYFTPGTETGQELSQWLQGATPETAKGLVDQVSEQLFNLGLGSRYTEYEAYIQEKYGAPLQHLSAAQLHEQLQNLQKCEVDEELYQRFCEYLAGKAA